MGSSLHNFWQLFLYNPKSPLVFNSALFLFLFFFFLIFYIRYEKNYSFKVIYVSLFSLFFYYKCSGIYFLILIASTVVDFFLSKYIYAAKDKRRKKMLLVLSLVVNLGMLAYFKYTNFLIQIFGGLTGHHYPELQILLPVGISFYTFQSLSYTIDVYRDEIKPLDNFLDYYFCISFFPHLVAGPIIRASILIPQLKNKLYLTKSQVGQAFFQIIAGLIKKAVISDYISMNFVDRVFDNPLLYSSFENLSAAYGYTLQIYCDFSGYSDIAIGIAMLIGFKLPINFDSPYQSASVTEFWRRWHISLSSWLRDYLYIPLGGNRKGKLRQYLNLFATMLLGGLWHGASWKFVFWGAMHGIALAIEKFASTFIKIKKTRFTHILGVLLTFHFVCFCWIYFRASSFEVANNVLAQIAKCNLSFSILIEVISAYKYIYLLLLIGYVIHFVPKKHKEYLQLAYTKTPLVVKPLILFLVIWLIVQVKSSEILPFIYFQF